MKKCAKVKNPCKICFETVSNKNGLRCQGACKKWVHYNCLHYTPGKIQDIKAGLIRVNCPCPDCVSENKEELVDTSNICDKLLCPARLPPKCEVLRCPKNLQCPNDGGKEVQCPEDCPSPDNPDIPICCAPSPCCPLSRCAQPICTPPKCHTPRTCPPSRRQTSCMPPCPLTQPPPCKKSLTDISSNCQISDQMKDLSICSSNSSTIVCEGTPKPSPRGTPGGTPNETPRDTPNETPITCPSPRASLFATPRYILKLCPGPPLKPRSPKPCYSPKPPCQPPKPPCQPPKPQCQPPKPPCQSPKPPCQSPKKPPYQSPKPPCLPPRPQCSSSKPPCQLKESSPKSFSPPCCPATCSQPKCTTPRCFTVKSEECSKGTCIHSVADVPVRPVAVSRSFCMSSGSNLDSMSAKICIGSKSECIIKTPDAQRQMLLIAIEQMYNTVGNFSNQFRDLMCKMIEALEKC